MAAKRNISPSRSRPSSQVPKKRPSRTFWIKTLTEFSKSGLSAQTFCRLNGLSASNFSTWRKRLREEEASASAESASFIPLEVMPTAPSLDPTKEIPQNQQMPFSPEVEKEGSDSGLTLHVNKNLKINIDKGFHEATLQRLLQLFSSGKLSTC